MVQETNSQTPQAPEQVSSNYFEQVNHEFDEAMKNQTLDVNTIEDIKARNETHFVEKIWDAIKKPGEAVGWLKNTMIASFASSWLGEIFGMKKKLDESKEKIADALTNPVNILTGALAGFGSFKILKKLGLNVLNPAGLSSKAIKGVFGNAIKLLKLSGGVAVRVAAIGAVIYGIVKLYEHFTSNPEDAQNMPEDPNARRAWWVKTLESLGIEDEAESIVALVAGDQTAAEMFKGIDAEAGMPSSGGIEDEDSEAPAETSEYHEKYGEMIPLKEKTKDIEAEIGLFVKKIGKFFLDHPYLTAAAGFVGLQFDAIRKLTTGAVTFSAETLFNLAKMPVKAVKGYPITTIFSVLGVLYALDEAGELMVPKDDEQFKQYLKDILNRETEEAVEETETQTNRIGQWLRDHDIAILEEDIDLTSIYLTSTEALATAFDNLGEVTLGVFIGAVELSGLSEEEQVFETNYLALGRFYREVAIKHGRDPAYEAFFDQLLILKARCRKKESISIPDLEKLRLLGEEVRIDLINDDGIYYWTEVDENGTVISGPYNFCIDPTLSAEEQFEKSNYFYVEDTWSEAGEKLMNIQINHLRRLGNDFTEIMENIQDGVVSGSFELVFWGGSVILEGATEKYILGPIEVWGEALDQLTDWDLNITELAIAYGQAIMPVAIFTSASLATSAVLKKKRASGRFKILASTAAYPYTGTVKAANVTTSIVRNLIVPALSDRKQFVHNLKNNRFASFFQEHKHAAFRWANNFSFASRKIKGGLGSEMNRELAKDIENLQGTHERIMDRHTALRKLYEADNAFFGRKRTKLIAEANKILNLSGDEALSGNIKDIIGKVEGEITEFNHELNNRRLVIDMKIDVAKEQNNLKKLVKAEKLIKEANQARNEGNPNKAKRKFKKAKGILENSTKGGKELAKKVDLKALQAPIAMDVQIREQEKLIAGKEEKINIIENDYKNSAHWQNAKEIKKSSKKAEKETKKRKTPETGTDQGKTIHPSDERAKMETETNKKVTEFDKLKEPEKIKKIQNTDVKLLTSLNEYRQKQLSWIKKLSFQGKSITKSPEILNLNKEFKAEIKQLYHDRVRFTENFAKAHPDVDLKKKGLKIDQEVLTKLNLSTNNTELVEKGALDDSIKNKKIKLPGKMEYVKGAGKAGLAAGALVLITYITGAALEEFTGEADLAESFKEEKEKNEENEKKNEEEDLDTLIESMEMLNEVFSMYAQEYSTYLASLQSMNALDDYMKEYPDADPPPGLENLEDLDDEMWQSDKLIKFVDRQTDKHKEILAEVMMIIAGQHELINKAFKNSPELQDHGFPIVGAMLKIRWDKEEGFAYLQYADEEEFKEFSYQMADHTLSYGTAWEFGSNFIPFYGSYRDLWRASKQFYRGNTDQAWKDWGWGFGGVALDTASAGMGGSLIKGGAKGTIKGAGKATKYLGKSQKTISTLNTGADLAEAGVFPAVQAIDAYIDGEEGETFSGKYYAFSPENAQDIPYDPNGKVIRMSMDSPTNESLEAASEEYSDRIMRYIEGCYWKNLDWEVLEVGKVKIKRKTSDQEVIIHEMEDGCWQLEGDLEADGGYDTFEQAVAMANLANKTAEWLIKEEIDPGSDSPFHISYGGDIEMDESYTPIDINVFYNDSHWLEFYERSFDIPKHWIVNLLNRLIDKIY